MVAFAGLTLTAAAFAAAALSVIFVVSAFHHGGHRAHGAILATIHSFSSATMETTAAARLETLPLRSPCSLW